MIEVSESERTQILSLTKNEGAYLTLLNVLKRHYGQCQAHFHSQSTMAVFATPNRQKIIESALVTSGKVNAVSELIQFLEKQVVGDK